VPNANSGEPLLRLHENRGDPAGAYRVILYTRRVSIPMPMMPTPKLSMAFPPQALSRQGEG
jgi:hypothetical protein